MTLWLLGAILVACAVAAVLVVIHLVRDEVTGDPAFLALGVAEVLAVAQLVGGCIALASTDRDVAGGLFVSYLVVNVLALPAGALFSLFERSRAGSAILLLAVATVAALEARLWDIWGGAGA